MNHTLSTVRKTREIPGPDDGRTRKELIVGRLKESNSQNKWVLKPFQSVL